MKIERIYPECNADTMLVQLILQRGLPIHCKNIHKVAKSLENFSNNNLFIIGVIDDDKSKNVPTYIKGFKVFENNENKIKEECLAILNLPGTNKYVIRLHPAFEKWILFVAESCGINPANYGFDNFEKIKAAAKGPDVYDNKDFKKFVNAIIQQNPPAIQTLKFWLDKAKDV